jgi:hypothetical protein
MSFDNVTPVDLKKGNGEVRERSKRKKKKEGNEKGE